MTIFIPQNDAERVPLAQWAAQRLPGAGQGWKDFHAVGVFRRGQPAAVAIYYNFVGMPGTDYQCNINFVSDDPLWATRQTVTFVLLYPLVMLNCRRITALTEAGNSRIHKLLQGVGFVKEGRHRDMFADGDGVSFGMTQRWFLKSKWYRWYGKEVRARAA